jgi:hypothetical protein
MHVKVKKHILFVLSVIQMLITDTSIEGNRQNGVLVRDQGTAEIQNCSVRSNEDYGVSVTFGRCIVSKSTKIESNRKGVLLEGPGADVAFDA